MEIIQCKTNVSNSDTGHNIFQVRGRMGAVLKREILHCSSDCQSCEKAECVFKEGFVADKVKPFSIRRNNAGQIIMSVFNARLTEKLSRAFFRAAIQDDEGEQILPRRTIDITQIIEYAKASRIKVVFDEPVNIKSRGKMARLSAGTLFEAISRRAKALNHFYQSGIEIPPAAEEAFKKVSVLEYQMKPKQKSRLSHRQRRMIPMKGLVGSAVFNMESLTQNEKQAMIEALLIGEALQIGKATTLGFGSYRLEKA